MVKREADNGTSALFRTLREATAAIDMLSPKEVRCSSVTN